VASVKPSPSAVALGAEVQKDPRLVELILSESGAGGALARAQLLIVEHRLGFVMSNAGIDQSNVARRRRGAGAAAAQGSDASAEALRGAARRDAVMIIAVSAGRGGAHDGVAIGAAACRRCSTCAAIPTCRPHPAGDDQRLCRRDRGGGLAVSMVRLTRPQPVVIVRGPAGRNRRRSRRAGSVRRRGSVPLRPLLSPTGRNEIGT